MLALCENDKDTFIEWLRVLNKTYLSNVFLVKELENLFKVKNKDKSAKASEAPGAPDAPATPAAAPTEEAKPNETPTDPEKVLKMIDTKAAAPNAEEKNAEEAEDPLASIKNSQVPIYMIKSLIRLLNKDKACAEVEQSAFQQDSDGTDNYSTKQLQKLWQITLESLISKTYEVDKMVETGVLEQMIQAFLQSTEEIK